MTNRFKTALSLAALMLAATPGVALAHITLSQSTPAADARVKQVRTIDLSFSAPVDAKTVAAQVVMTGMPGMTDHPPMMIKAFTIAQGADEQSATIKLAKPLVPGDYTVKWSAAGSDGHRVTGSFVFVVE